VRFLSNQRNLKALQDRPQSDVQGGARLRGPNVPDRAVTCQLFVEDRTLPEKPDDVRSPPSEALFRLLLAPIEGATREVGTENASDLESLSTEFEFVELGWRVGGSFRSTITSRSAGLSRRYRTCGGSWRGRIGSFASL
jgi:hypothetical protein